MIRIQLQNSAHLHVEARLHPLHVLLHLEAHAVFCLHAHGVAAQLRGQANLLHLISQRLLHKGQEALQLLGLLLSLLLLLLGLQAQILGGHIAGLLLLVGHQALEDKLVHILVAQQHIVALGCQSLHLRQLGKLRQILAGGEVDLLLPLGHGVHILLQADALTLLVAVEQQQVGANVLVGAVVGDGAVLQVSAEGIEELLVVLTLVIHHVLQLGLDLLLQIPGDDGELAVMLQHFPADVQAEILAVHNAPDETEVFRQQVGAVLHDHHAGGIQLQAGLVVLGVEIVGGLLGDIQQSLEGDGTLGAGMNHPQGLIVVEELLPVEGFILLLGHILLCPLPDGHHGVQGFHLGVGLILGLVLVAALLHPGLLHLHADGVADIVGILPHQRADLVLLQIVGILVLLGVGLQGHDHISAGGGTGGLLDGVAVRAVRGPLPRGVLAVLAGNHGDGGGHHKGGVESHAELTDDVNVLLLLHSLLEAQRAGLGDGAQILLQLSPGHTDAVVGNRQSAVFLIPGDGDGKVITGKTHLVIGESRVGQLVDGIGGVGENLPEEDLPVGVDGIDHQVQQALGFGLKLHFFHSF